jgi:tetratricopeptide (TPR) repeat protein
LSTPEIFTEKASILLQQEDPPLVELRKVLLDVDDYINSNEFGIISEEKRLQLQGLRKDLKDRIYQIDQGVLVPSIVPLPPDVDAPTIEISEPETSPEPQPEQPHGYNPEADPHMEAAEKLFYSGRYAEAIRLFDKVLNLEPKWERARQHRSEAENYLRTGYIPPVALPSEAASAFGKAQSAARVSRYEDALALLQKAQVVLRESGIQRWQEGLEFEQKLQENIDAEKVYQEGIQLFNEGRLDEAIERVESAARATGLPKFRDRAQNYRRVRERIRSIQETLSALSYDPKVIGQAKMDLDLMIAEYGVNPALDRLALRLQTAIPRTVAPLKEQVRTLKVKAERAETLVDALSYLQQAKSHLDAIRELTNFDENLERLQDEVDHQFQNLSKIESDLNTARTAYENRPTWPSQAYTLSQEARLQFPQDPQVQQINRSLAGYKAIRLGFQAGAVLIVLILLYLFGLWGVRRFQAYQLARTPSPTSTATITPTSTLTATSTATGTWTPTPTATFTPTPTPIFGFARRDIWARNGCYEEFTATGRIPTGGQVNFLTSERRFDQFSRECALVEYNEFGRSIIGWILLVDVSPVDITPSP